MHHEFRVTALGLVDPVARGSYSLRPKRGRRWVGVRVRLEGKGPGRYRDSPDNASLVLAGRRAFRADSANPDGCPTLEAIVRLAPGESVSGCVIFEVPRGKRVRRFRYAPSSGFAPDVASWRLPAS